THRPPSPPLSPYTTLFRSAAKPQEPKRGAKLSFNDKRELEALPQRISALEAEQAGLHVRLADPTLYQSAPDEVTSLKARLDALRSEEHTSNSSHVKISYAV